MNQMIYQLEYEILAQIGQIQEILKEGDISEAKVLRLTIEDVYGDYLKLPGLELDKLDIQKELSDLDKIIMKKESGKEETKDILPFEDALDERIKSDRQRRQEKEAEFILPETQEKIDKFDRQMEDLRSRTKEYNSDIDYYEDIYYIKGLFGKKYYSNYSHGKRINKNKIPASVINKIRDCETFYTDSLYKAEDKCENLNKEIEYKPLTDSESRISFDMDRANQAIKKTKEEIILLRVRVKELEDERENLRRELLEAREELAKYVN